MKTQPEGTDGMPDPEDIACSITAEVRNGVLRIMLLDERGFEIDGAEVACADIIKEAKNPPQFETG